VAEGVGVLRGKLKFIGVVSPGNKSIQEREVSKKKKKYEGGNNTRA